MCLYVCVYVCMCVYAHSEEKWASKVCEAMENMVGWKFVKRMFSRCVCMYVCMCVCVYIRIQRRSGLPKFVRLWRTWSDGSSSSGCFLGVYVCMYIRDFVCARGRGWKFVKRMFSRHTFPFYEWPILFSMKKKTSQTRELAGNLTSSERALVVYSCKLCIAFL